MRELVHCKKEQEHCKRGLVHCMKELEHYRMELEHCMMELELHRMPGGLKDMYYTIKEEIDSQVEITSVT